MDKRVVCLMNVARYLVLIAVWLCSVMTVKAQFPSWEDFMEQLLVGSAEDDGAMTENLYDDYMYLHAHPININSADSVELRQLGFLTGRQIEGIHYYINRYGALRSVGELMLIPELDYHTRQLLSYMVVFGELAVTEEPFRETLHRMLTQGRSELSTRMDIPFYTRSGYAQRTQDQLANAPSRYYMGNALYHNLRYTYRYGSKLSWGISSEKDAGEPIFTSLQPLPDYFSGYIQVSDMGWLKNLVVGNYRLHFGRGLVMNSDYALNKTMLLQSLGDQTMAVKPHRGTGEDGYYTGAAATMAWDVLQLTVFGGYRRIDATLNGEGISTLANDGYHRTLLELARRGNTRGNLFGLHLGYSAHGFHVGATAMCQAFNRSFRPSEQPYKRYSPQGHRFSNVSVDYAWHHHRFSIVGETAIDGKWSLATLNMFRFEAAEKLYLTLLQRHYACDYWALEGKSVSAASEVRNEQGLYWGVEWQPYYQMHLTAYADVYRFPFLRYRVSQPSQGADAMLMACYDISEGHQLQLRYRYRMKKRDVAEGYRLLQGGLVSEHTHRLRLRWAGKIASQYSCQLTGEGCMVQAERLSAGYMGSAQLTYEPSSTAQHTFRISGGATVFSTDYAARIYGYERGALYAYNYQTFYGKGWRSYLLMQYSHKSAPRLSCMVKLGATCYLDRTVIGSGAAAIENNHREDLQLQLRYTY